MREWHYRIRGLRQHLTEDESPDGIKKAAGGVADVLQGFVDKAKTNLPTTLQWQLDEYDIEKLEEIIEEMRDAGGIGDCGDMPDLEWFNGVLAGMYDYCDGYNIWIETDHPETGV